MLLLFVFQEKSHGILLFEIRGQLVFAKALSKLHHGKCRQVRAEGVQGRRVAVEATQVAWSVQTPSPSIAGEGRRNNARSAGTGLRQWQTTVEAHVPVVAHEIDVAGEHEKLLCRVQELDGESATHGHTLQVERAVQQLRRFRNTVSAGPQN